VPEGAKVSDYMTPFKDMITGEDGITLSDANDLIWKHKVNQLPIIDKDGRLVGLVFRKDYIVSVRKRLSARKSLKSLTTIYHTVTSSECTKILKILPNTKE
jgi:CBS-domain-containing membrane protein